MGARVRREGDPSGRRRIRRDGRVPVARREEGGRGRPLRFRPLRRTQSRHDRALACRSIMEEICWGCAGIGLAIFGTGLPLSALAAAGTPEQLLTWAPRMFGTAEDPKVAAFCVTEPNAGSDVVVAPHEGRERRRWMGPQRDEGLRDQRRDRRRPHRRRDGRPRARASAARRASSSPARTTRGSSRARRRRSSGSAHPTPPR